MERPELLRPNVSRRKRVRPNAVLRLTVDAAAWSLAALAPGGLWTQVVDHLSTIVLASVGGVILLWLALVAVLLAFRPSDLNPTEALRLLPDTLVLIRRLAVDRALPRGVRIRLHLLLAYLIMPIDLIPDFPRHRIRR